MINNYKQFNEGINHLLVGPTDEEIWDNYMNGELKGLIKSIPTSPEDFFKQIIEHCDIIEENIYGTIYGKNGIKLFLIDINNKFFHFDYIKIWSILEKVYSLGYNEIQYLINNGLRKYTKLNNLSYKQIWYYYQNELDDEDDEDDRYDDYRYTEF